MHTPPSRRPSSGFSLLEMLVVMAIAVILLALVVPPVGQVADGYLLTRQGQILSDQLVLARQRATARNRDVEVRLLREDDRWVLQIWELDPAAGTASAVNRRMPLDAQLTIHPELSPLLNELPSDSLDGQSWKSLRFRPNGRLALPLTMENNYLTLYLRRDQGAPPQNYFTLQIHPLSGHISVYRP